MRSRLDLKIARGLPCTEKPHFRYGLLLFRSTLRIRTQYLISWGTKGTNRIHSYLSHSIQTRGCCFFPRFQAVDVEENRGIRPLNPLLRY